MNYGIVLLFLLLLLNTHNAILAPAAKKSPRIIGGSVTSIDKVPYLMQLRKHGQFLCGGSLVASQFVVTAAHCVKGVAASSLTVVGGASALSETGERRGVEKVFIPKEYNTKSLHMDAAVLKLSRDMAGRSIETIGLCAANSKWNVGEEIQVSGWGLTSENGHAVSQRVRTVNVPLISKSKCKEQYKNHETLTSSMFCASLPGVSDSCAGDSGGPAIYKGQLCGIVSWGIGCARSNYPGVYTSVRSVKTFIERAMQK